MKKKRFRNKIDLMKAGFIAERAKQLKIASLSVSEGLRAGSFGSVFRGQGIEFDSVREYEIGDDVRSIDWNLTARSGKTFIKMYREERDLTLFLCVDFSLSMDVDGGKNAPKEKALETAALLTFAGAGISSQTGAVFFDGERGPLFMPHSNSGHISALLKTMENFAAKNHAAKKGTELASAITVVSKILRQRSMVIIISDFKVEGFEKKLGLLAAGHDVICIRIIGALDRELPAAGALRFRDMESDLHMLLPTSSKTFRIEYKKKFYEELERWQGMCKRCMAYPVLLNTEDDPVTVLSDFFLSNRRGQKKLKHSIDKIKADVWKAF